MNRKIHTVKMAKVTAVLCAIVALLSLVFFFASDPGWKVESLNSQITYTKESIAELENLVISQMNRTSEINDRITALTASLDPAKIALNEANDAVGAATSALKTAEDNLDAVCLRSYYSSFYCETEDCKPLHSAVKTQSQALADAEENVDTCQRKISDIEQDIADAEEELEQAESSIESTQNRIAEQNATLSDLEGQLVGAWLSPIFGGIILLIVIAALGLLAFRFFNADIDAMVLYGCYALAGASALYLLIGAIAGTMPLRFILLNPHTWNLVVMGCFAAVLTQRTANPVRLRTFAIIASVLVGLLGSVLGNPIVAILYAATMICTSFLLVPLVFTPYIPIAKHIFLSLITFGIWTLVWVYQITKYLNNASNCETRKPGCELLLCLFLPFYWLYWILKTAEIVEDYGAENQKIFKLEVFCVAMAVVNLLFSTVLLQNKVNYIVGKPQPAPEPEAQEPATES